MSEWAKVSECLPGLYEYVMTYGSHLDVWPGSVDDKGEWWDYENTFLENVTHWMPFPEPPDERYTKSPPFETFDSEAPHG